MGDFIAASDTITPLTAVLWVFYPMTALVLIELILRAINDDDDDQDGGKGIRITNPQLATVPSGT
jgi:cytochrome c-type biogenesis protein CcmH/NrfF|tara:strand:- start:546 stop:740 length:195 start_codon:yes stop_codon:yes gene_type:complete